MALDWTFPTQPGEDLDAHYFDLNNPELHVITSPRSSDLFDGIAAGTPEDAFRLESYSSDFASLEPWAGLGCTCGLEFIACTEHSDLSTTGSIAFSPGTITDQHNRPHATDKSQSDAGALSDYRTDTLHSDTQKVASVPITEQQTISEPKKFRMPPLSREIKRTLDNYFAMDPYPKKRDIEYLAHCNGVGPKSVAHWFSNARARKGRIESKSSLDVLHVQSVGFIFL
jgi:hypothetical protein